MEPSERDYFSRLEKELYVDLAPWRIKLMGLATVQLAILLRKVRDGETAQPLTIDSPEGIDLICGAQKSWLDRSWDTFNPHLELGDPVIARGNFFYNLNLVSSGDFSYELIKSDKQLRGLFESIEVGSFVDEEYFRVSHEPGEVVMDDYMRHFGVLMALSHPTIVDDHFRRRTLPYERVYVPLNYEEIKLMSNSERRPDDPGIDVGDMI